MVATAVEDFRCRSLHDSALIVTEDPRYTRLGTRLSVEIEDSRYNSVAVAMEDPRCQALSLNW